MTEVWKPVVGFEGLYEVSDLGRVRCHPMARGKGRTPGLVLSPSRIGKRGYLLVHLRRPGKKAKPVYVHTLVLEAFVGPRPSGADACHDPDPNPANCTLSNLRWDTRRGNLADKRGHGTQTRGEAHPVSKLTEADVREMFRLRASGMTQAKIAHRFGVSHSLPHLIFKRKLWSHLEIHP